MRYDCDSDMSPSDALDVVRLFWHCGHFVTNFAIMSFGIHE
jgi:hypothetical protein